MAKPPRVPKVTYHNPDSRIVLEAFSLRVAARTDRHLCQLLGAATATLLVSAGAALAVSHAPTLDMVACTAGMFPGLSTGSRWLLDQARARRPADGRVPLPVWVLAHCRAGEVPAAALGEPAWMDHPLLASYSQHLAPAVADIVQGLAPSFEGTCADLVATAEALAGGK